MKAASDITHWKIASMVVTFDDGTVVRISPLPSDIPSGSMLIEEAKMQRAHGWNFNFNAAADQPPAIAP